MGKGNKNKRRILNPRKYIISRLRRLIQRTDTLLALLAIALWGMLWTQEYTNIDGFTNFLHRITEMDRDWGCFNWINWSTPMHRAVSLFYWGFLLLLFIVVIVLGYAAFDLFFGKEKEGQPLDRREEIGEREENRRLQNKMEELYEENIRLLKEQLLAKGKGNADKQ